MKKLIQSLQVIGLSVLLPALYGCQGGGLGSLIGSGGIFLAASSGGSSAGGAAAITGGAGSSLATLHNPEPATLMLMGSGMMVMAYARMKNKKR